MKKILFFSAIFFSGYILEKNILSPSKSELIKRKKAIGSVKLRGDKRYIWRNSELSNLPGTNTNAEGFRDTESFAKKINNSCNQFVIVILGSSSTFGLGVPFSQTIGPLLEEKLRQHGVSVRVFNLGQVAFSAIQGNLLAEEWFIKLKPDLVIVSFGYVESIFSKFNMSDEQMLLIHDSWISKVPVQFLRTTWAYISGRGQVRASMDEYRKNLLKISSQAKVFNAKTFILPSVRKAGFVLKERADLSVYDQIKQLSSKDFKNESDIFFFDSVNRLTDPKFYAKDGSHFNQEGFQALTTILLPEIKNYLNKKLPNHICAK